MLSSPREKERETDCRCLDHKALSELSKQAVLQVQNGTSPEIVAMGLGINRTTIYDWLAPYRNGGWAALKAKKRGVWHRKLNGKAWLGSIALSP